MFFLKTSCLLRFVHQINSLVGLAILLFVLSFCQETAASDVIRIGSKRFTENQILATLTAKVLQKNGYNADVLYNIGTNHSPRSMLLEGRIDIYWEYTGTAYKLYLNGNDEKIEKDSNKLYQYVKSTDKNNGIVWLKKAAINNTYVIMVSKELSETHKIKTITELSNWYAKKENSIPFITLESFYSRPDGFRNLSKTYDLSIGEKNLIQMRSYTTAYRLVADKKALAGIGFGTNAELKHYDLQVLEDNKNFFPVYNPAPNVREGIISKHPRIKKLIDQMTVKLNQDEIIRLNYDIDFANMKIDERCDQWLIENNLT